MARIFITGSTDGLGRAAARTLLDEGHEVLLHARSAEAGGRPSLIWPHGRQASSSAISAALRKPAGWPAK